MTTFDDKKRKTLKAMAGTGIGMVAGSLSVVSVADAAIAASTSSALPLPTKSVQFDLDLSIVSSQGVVENTLLLKNTTDETMHIARFRSDNIVFDNKSVSLSEVTDQGPITLEPGQTLSFQVSVVELNDAAPMEYVYADHCVNHISSDCVDVHLGGFMVDHDVMVVTGHQQPIDVVL